MHLISHNNWNITSYKTVPIATGLLASIRLLPHNFFASLKLHPSNEFGIAQVLICCHGHPSNYVVLLNFDDFV